MRLPLLFSITLPLLAVGCASTPQVNQSDVMAQFAGAWDEVHKNSCSKPHVISFDEQGHTMFVTYAEFGVTDPVPDVRKVFRYKILDWWPQGIRVALENEPRLDSQGKPVVWHIKLINDKTYCWGRDDWAPRSCTPVRIRCGL